MRKALRQARRAISTAERNTAARRAARHLARLARACGVRHVAAYLALSEEMATRPAIRLLQRQGCRIYVPKLAGAQLRFAPLRGALKRNRYRIAEPVAARRPPRLDLIVMPLVAFDAGGARLG
ncbi:MAG: 5-formyltetrahydrofolate cyclo-ligase, partial [Nevskiaceae bacterium]